MLFSAAYFLFMMAQDAMDLRVRDRLPAALCWSMAGITAFFFAFGTAGYLAYGNDVANFITMASALKGTALSRIGGVQRLKLS